MSDRDDHFRGCLPARSKFALTRYNARLPIATSAMRMKPAWIALAALAIMPVACSSPDRRTSAVLQPSFEAGLSVTRPCRLSITVEGQPMFDRLLQAGEHMPFDALVRGEMVLTASDAGAVVMALDGLEAKPLGKAGEPVTVRITLANFQEYLLSPRKVAIRPKQQPAVIAGRVVGPDGKPLVNASVMAFTSHRTADGAVMAAGEGEAKETDDRGEFRLFDVQPGDHYVLARRSTRRDPDSASPMARTILAPTFFPSTRDVSTAKLVTVAAGQEVRGIEIKMVSTAGWVVSGTVTDSKLEPVARAVVTLLIWPSLTPPDVNTGIIAVPDFSPDQWVASTVADANGNFSIGEVPSGTYTLISSTARMRLTVDKDVNGLKVITGARP